MGLVLTSSWDDGDPRDLRLAEKLSGAGWAATFYLCREFGRHRRLSESEIVALASIPGVEIGAHTLTHPDVRRLNEAQLREEVGGSRRWLEDVLGREVRSFCYPSGLHNRRAARAVAEAGYLLGRTTLAASTSIAFDRFRMPTTMQVYPHSRRVQLRHAAKEGNVRGAYRIATMSAWPKAPSRLAKALVESLPAGRPSLLHFWGHSWEIDELDLWPELDALVQVVADHEVDFATNADVVRQFQLDAAPA